MAEDSTAVRTQRVPASTGGRIATRVRPPQFTAAAGSTLPPSAPVAASPPECLGSARVTPAIGDLRFIDSGFAREAAAFRPMIPAVPREQLTVPISPVPDPNDEVLFEDPKDPAKRYYLPRYRISPLVVSGEQRYQVAFKADGDAWVLEVRLQKFPAPSIADAARGCTEIDHTISVLLRHRQIMGGEPTGEEELSFDDVTTEAGEVRAALHIATLGERDLLYQVLTTTIYGATLSVLRLVTLGFPMPTQGTPPGPPINIRVVPTAPRVPIARARAGEGEAAAVPLRAVPATPGPITGVPLRPRPGSAVPAIPGPARPGVPVRPGRMRPIEPDPDRPGPIRPLPRPLPVDPTPTPTPTPQPQVPLFRALPRVLDTTVEPRPFVFPPALHGYVFVGISGTPGQTFELVRHLVPWQGRPHSYYQNPARPQRFYVLPDVFKVARRLETPHHPMMNVRFEAVAGPLEQVQVAMEYIALPQVDARRTDAAVAALSQLVVGRVPEGTPIELEPLLVAADKISFRVSIPTADAGGGPFQSRPQANVDLRSGIHDALTLPLPQFNTVFEALFGASAILFTGWIDLELPGGLGESIPFEARMENLAGQVLDYGEQPLDGEDGFRAEFRNAIESPVQLAALSAVVRRGGGEAPATFEGLEFSSPLRIEAAAKLSFGVRPAASLPGSGPVSVEYDLGALRVLPDREAVWAAILDPGASAHYLRTIKVKSFKQRFDPPPDRPDQQVVAIVVDFEAGASVELNTDQLEVEIDLPLPIADIVLRRPDAGRYRYKVTVVRLAGQTQDAEWRTDSTGILFPDAR